MKHLKLIRYEVFMYWDVRLVKPLPDHRIYVEIENKQKGVFCRE